MRKPKKKAPAAPKEKKPSQVDQLMKKLEPLFNKISKLSKGQRIGIVVGVCVLILAPYIYFVYLDKSKEIKGLRANLSELENKLVIAKKKASQRNKLRMEMKKAQLQFNIAKKALPESEEIPTLLTSISHAGQDAGLEFLLFEPKPEKEAGFYAKIPVSMTVEGNYHDVAKFFNMVAGLSRIVNIVDIRMETDDKNREGVIKTSCKAITYRFIEQTQETAPSKNKS